ncbi:methyltransferase [Rhodobacterales bacterium HKCCE3408]|nr:methyltransferase [Rhodobacterales bacterium HKCCE3408]
MSDPKTISTALEAHYRSAFNTYGQTPQGVDWGKDAADHVLRLDRMLAVLEAGTPTIQPAILDVGAGYGSLLVRALERGIALDYCALDLCAPMIEAGRKSHPDAAWKVGDILDETGNGQYDYVVCNGVLTQKLTATQAEMDAYLKAVVTRMFALARIGIAFNVMTTHVNFTAPNLYYRNPAELLAWAMSELSPRVRLDHAYPLFEYTLYLYHANAPGLTYGAHRSQARG